MPLQRHPITHASNDETLAKFPLDLALIGRLQADFELVRLNGRLLGRIFYQKLFTAAPHLRPLFKHDLDAQATKLVDSLEAVIRHLEHPEEVSAMLKDLGRRHVAYGAKPEHYELVISILTDSMREMLGLKSEDPCVAEWDQALRLVSRQMIAAAEPPPHDQPNPPARN